MVKPGYKQTEIGVIPEDWAVLPISNAVESLEAGVSVNSVDEKQKVSSHSESILKTSAVSNGRFIPEESKKVAPRDLSRLKCSPRADSIIISRMNTPELVGECGYVLHDYVDLFLPDRLWMTKRQQQNNSSMRWMAYLLSSKPQKTRIRELATGTSGSMKNLSKPSLMDLHIAFPSLPEQQAIATALSDADELIGSLEQLLTKKRQIKQGAMQELLTGKKRLSGFSGEWEVKKLGEVIKITKGQLITEKNAIPGTIPVIAGGKKPAYYHNKPNRIGKTVTISASGANAGYVAFFDGPIFASDCSTVSESGDYSIEYVYSLLQSKQTTIYKAQTGGAQPHIHATDLNPIEVLWPSVPEQTAIAEVLSDMDAEIEALETKLTKARQVKQGMMQELLTGRIRLV